jgi:hypothetical protein
MALSGSEEECRRADTLNAALSLLEPGRIPWHVDVHLAAKSLKVQTLAGRVRSNQQSYFLVLDLLLQQFAVGE